MFLGQKSVLENHDPGKRLKIWPNCIASSSIFLVDKPMSKVIFGF